MEARLVSQLADHPSHEGRTQPSSRSGIAQQAYAGGANQALAGHQDIVVPVAERLQEHHKLLRLMKPPTNGHVGVHFNYAQSLLVRTLAYNWLLYPDQFNLDRVESEVLAFLQA